MFVNLAKLRLVLGNGYACAVEDNKASTGGPLINGANEPFLEVITPPLFVLENGAVPVIRLLRGSNDMRLPLVVDLTLIDLEVLGLGVPINAVVVELERVSHFRGEGLERRREGI